MDSPMTDRINLMQPTKKNTFIQARFPGSADDKDVFSSDPPQYSVRWLVIQTYGFLQR